MIKNQAGLTAKVDKKRNCKGEVNRISEVLFYFRRAGYSFNLNWRDKLSKRDIFNFKRAGFGRSKLGIL